MIEWCVMDDFSDGPHRGLMTESEARQWIAGAEKDGMKPGTFYIAQRTVGPWERSQSE